VTIDDAVERMPGWAAARPAITPLAGGITNTNFRVDVAAASFVVRLPGAQTSILGIDRQREVACSRVAHAVGIGPEVVAFLEPEGILVTRFIPGIPVTPGDAGDPAMLRRMAASLRRVHDGPAFPGTFRPFGTVIDYLRACGPDTVLPRGFTGILRQAEAVDRVLRATAPPDRSCHNDLLAANFIDDGTTIRILDWEYAAMGDPFFDLGNFAANQELDEAGVRMLVEAYAGRVTDADLARVALMRILSDLREAMWGEFQLKLSSIDFDFSAYALRHFSRCASQLADPKTESNLGVVSRPN